MSEPPKMLHSKEVPTLLLMYLMSLNIYLAKLCIFWASVKGKVLRRLRSCLSSWTRASPGKMTAPRCCNSDSRLREQLAITSWAEINTCN